MSIEPPEVCFDGEITKIEYNFTGQRCTITVSDKVEYPEQPCWSWEFDLPKIEYTPQVFDKVAVKVVDSIASTGDTFRVMARFKSAVVWVDVDYSYPSLFRERGADFSRML